MLPSIEILGLTKEIEQCQILKIDCLRFASPGIYGLIGPNGAGKTTFLKCICGLLFPDSGRVMIDQTALNQNNRVPFLRQIGTVFAQTDSLFDLSIDELLTEHYYFFGLKRPGTWQSVLADVGLDVLPNQKIGSLSLGMRQRLSLAVALSHEPAILILDEPFNGLDPDGVALMKSRIRRFAEDKIVIIASHSFTDLEDLITAAVVMDHGCTGELKTLTEIRHVHRDGLAGFYHQ